MNITTPAPFIPQSTECAHYEYSPFGEVLTATGSTAEENTHRFSTKCEDAETGLLYYGYRYYDPEMGRWLNRDPIGERGGLNVYGFTGNDGVNKIDLFGLQFIPPPYLADYLRPKPQVNLSPIDVANLIGEDCGYTSVDDSNCNNPEFCDPTKVCFYRCELQKKDISETISCDSACPMSRTDIGGRNPDATDFSIPPAGNSTGRG